MDGPVTARPQRRGRRIAMTDAELDAFLAEQRTCRVATVSADGDPHVTPLWFVWHDGSLWLTSLTRSQRWIDIERHPRIAVVVDAGVGYGELRGVELRGSATPVGEIPRTGAPVNELLEVERLYATKYGNGVMEHDGRHGWLRVRPDTLVSWDFRKLAR